MIIDFLQEKDRFTKEAFSISEVNGEGNVAIGSDKDELNNQQPRPEALNLTHN